MIITLTFILAHVMRLFRDIKMDFMIAFYFNIFDEIACMKKK